MCELDFLLILTSQEKVRKVTFNAFIWLHILSSFRLTGIIVLFGTENYSVESNTGLLIFSFTRATSSMEFILLVSVLYVSVSLWLACYVHFCSRICFEFWGLICVCSLQFGAFSSDTFRLRLLVGYEFVVFPLFVFVMKTCSFVCSCAYAVTLSFVN